MTARIPAGAHAGNSAGYGARNAKTIEKHAVMPWMV
jgi:hypothetical protein